MPNKIDKKSAVYRAWLTMLEQTNHPVAHRWLTYENFKLDMGRKPTPRHRLYRLNGDVGFGPANCAWRLPKDQNHHRCSCGRSCSGH